MIPALAANVAVLVGILVVGFAIDRYVTSQSKLAGLPWYLQWVVGGAAISPIVYFQDRLAAGPIDGLVVAFALSVALWIGLPALLARTVGTGDNGGNSGCEPSALPDGGGGQ